VFADAGADVDVDVGELAVYWCSKVVDDAYGRSGSGYDTVLCTELCSSVLLNVVDDAGEIDGNNVVRLLRLVALRA
jgi:hypothetical protein